MRYAVQSHPPFQGNSSSPALILHAIRLKPSRTFRQIPTSGIIPRYAEGSGSREGIRW